MGQEERETVVMINRASSRGLRKTGFPGLSFPACAPRLQGPRGSQVPERSGGLYHRSLVDLVPFIYRRGNRGSGRRETYPRS